MQGTLEAGGAKLRLALTVTRSEAATYTASLTVLTQGATIPIDTITVQRCCRTLEMKSVAIVYEGV